MTTISSSSDSRDDDSVSATAHNDVEINIRALPVHTRFDSVPPFKCNCIHRLLHDLKEGKKGWVQILTIYAAAILTYGCSNVKIERMEMNVQVATMTVITLVGASPFLSTHLLPATTGAFVGGHKIIGSVGSMDDVIVVTWTNYAWLFFLSLVVGLMLFVMNSKWKVLDGFSGRPGTTVFLGMNLVMPSFFGPLGVVGWNRYHYGLTEVLNSAEDSIPLARAWFEEAELAIGYVFAVISVGVVGGGTRVLHNDYVKRFDETHKDSPTMPSPLPLNNILVPVLWALLSMFLVMVSGYDDASVLFNGFAVGCYVAVASLQLIPSIAKFTTVSVLAAGWGLALTPFFVGFPGSMCSFCSENTDHPYQIVLFMSASLMSTVIACPHSFSARIWIHRHAWPCHVVLDRTSTRLVTSTLKITRAAQEKIFSL